MKLFFHKHAIGISILLSVGIITGCSVKPKAFDKSEIIKGAQEDLVQLNENENFTEPLSLELAIERGVNFNREKRVRVMETALAQNQLSLLNYDMLPDLAVNAGYSMRNNYAASSNAIFEDGEPQGAGSNTVYSVSQEKKQTNADMTFSWNILDFGLSYVRAEQQSDRYLIAKEQIRKVQHNITQEIRRAYYQAVTSEALLQKIHPLMKEVRAALKDSEKVKSLRLKSPMEALTYERELLDVLRDLSILQKTLISAKIELAELIGIKPNTEFTLEEKVQSSYNIPDLSFKLETMEKIALENRPEILESRYKERISQKELTVAKLKMLPGISIDAGQNYNDSSYLLNNSWNAVGASVTWNLFNIFKYPAMSDTADAKIALAKEKKLALSLAVITQVHLSVIRYKQTVTEYKLSKEYLDVSEEIYEQAMNANELNMSSKLVIIKEKLSYLLATMRHSSAHANMQNSYGRTYASLGIIEDSDVGYEKDMPKPEEPDFITLTKIMQEKRRTEMERIANIKRLEKIAQIKEIKRLEEINRLKRIEDAKRLQEIKRLEAKRRFEEAVRAAEIKKLEDIKEENKRKYLKEMKLIEEQKSIDEMNRLYKVQHIKEMQEISEINTVAEVDSKLKELKAELLKLKVEQMQEENSKLPKLVLNPKNAPVVDAPAVEHAPVKNAVVQPAKEAVVTLKAGDKLKIGTKTHLVKKGEKLWEISKTYNYKVRSIIKSNPWLEKQNRITYK